VKRSVSSSKYFSSVMDWMSNTSTDNVYHNLSLHIIHERHFAMPERSNSEWHDIFHSYKKNSIHGIVDLGGRPGDSHQFSMLDDQNKVDNRRVVSRYTSSSCLETSFL
jgi:hypothetical protein